LDKGLNPARRGGRFAVLPVRYGLPKPAAAGTDTDVGGTPKAMSGTDHPVPLERPRKLKRLAPMWRAAIEIGFIMFLFYSNLLMGEFTRANSVHGKTLIDALRDIFTLANFDIGIGAAMIGYLVVEYLRAKL
jgi:hypothetical protein